MISNTRHSETTEIKEFLISLIGSAPIGILALDLEQRCILANSWAGNAFGVKPEQLVDINITQIIDEWPEFKSRLSINEQKHRTEFNHRAVALNRRMYDVSSRTMVNGSLLTLHDVTDEFNIREQQAELVQRLENANRGLAEFAYICAHDMKSPVSNIIGLTEHLEKCDGNKEETQALLGMLSQSADKLHKKIRSLNHILVVKQSLGENDSRCNLKLVITDTVKSLRQDIDDVSADINIDVDSGTNLRVSDVHLHSILLNLLSNALKYRHRDRYPIVDISTKRSDSNTIITVSDNGIGFDLALSQQKLFGLFNRLHTHVEGDGVGLYLVKSIAESYGGQVSAQSVEGQGTTFRIELPHVH